MVLAKLLPHPGKRGRRWGDSTPLPSPPRTGASSRRLLPAPVGLPLLLRLRLRVGLSHGGGQASGGGELVPRGKALRVEDPSSNSWGSKNCDLVTVLRLTGCTP